MKKTVKLDNFSYFAVNYLSDILPKFSSKNLDLNIISRFSALIMTMLFIWLLYDQVFIFKFFLFFAGIIFFIALLFKLYLTLKTCLKQKDMIDYCLENDNINYPLYTILVPLYKEDKIIPHLLESMKKIDYPEDKLEILLLIEESDELTKETIYKQDKIADNFYVILVPDCHPKTKPKACNYGLLKARGKYITIYDAEDRPEYLQLKKSLAVFNNKNNDRVICVQAKLNYYNREDNLLSKLFALEYSNWFEFMLPALFSSNFIIPLGGNSNHFDRLKLLEIGGWDPYNVTEDAELGVRIRCYNYQTVIIDSTTLEEAPIDLINWLKQRTRWIKGYLQTYIIYLFNFKTIAKNFTFKEKIAFHLFFGHPVFIYLMTPFIFFGIIYHNFFANDLEVYWYHKIIIFTNLVMGISLPIFFALLSIKKHNWSNMKIAVLLFPCYYFLHVIASYRALIHLFKKTYYWEKTTHGISKTTIIDL